MRHGRIRHTHLHGKGVGEEEEISTASTDTAPLDHVEVSDGCDEVLTSLFGGREVWRHRGTQPEPR